MAVELTRSRGVPVLLRDLFARLPGEGRWPTALVIDGNIGIGGDVDRVLRRLDALLAADGRAVIETAPEPTTDRTMQVRFARGGVATGPHFAWSVIGAVALAARAARVGLVFAILDVAPTRFGGTGHASRVVPAGPPDPRLPAVSSTGARPPSPCVAPGLASAPAGGRR